MMQLQQFYLHGVLDYYCVSGIVFFMWKKLHIAIFADVPGSLWINSPDEATVKQKMKGVWHDKEKSSQPQPDQAYQWGF